MKSPEEIRSKAFKSRLFGGYPSQEVRTFLHEVAADTQELMARNEEMKTNLEACHQEINRLRQLETALLGAFKQAEEQKKEIIEQARQEAKMHLMKGEMSADNVLNAAKREAQDLLRRVKAECDLKIKQLNHEFSVLDGNFQEAEGHIVHVLKEMQRLVDETSHSIARIATLKDKKVAVEKMRMSKELLEAHESYTKRELEQWEKTHQVQQESKPAQPTPSASEPVALVAEDDKGQGKTLLQRLQENANGHSH